MRYSTKIIAQALRDYLRGQLTTKAIAKNYNVSMPSITVWAKRAGLRLRGRGRRPRDNPTLRQQQILVLAQSHTLEETGRRFGITKQGVHRIVRLWQKRGWA